MAHRSDRRGDTPITRLAFEAVDQRLAPRARISMMARSTYAPPTRPKIRLQSDHASPSIHLRLPPALRARQGPAAAFGGALRAALSRARALAWMQLRDEGKPSSLINERT
jgi:hypothetical protein